MRHGEFISREASVPYRDPVSRRPAWALFFWPPRRRVVNHALPLKGEKYEGIISCSSPPPRSHAQRSPPVRRYVDHGTRYTQHSNCAPRPVWFGTGV